MVLNSKYETGTISAQTTITQVTGIRATETAAAAAQVQILDGSSSGAIVYDSKLGAAGSDGMLLPNVKLAAGAAYVKVVAGAVTWQIYGL